MTKCKNYEVCGTKNSQACNSEYLAIGNCGIRKDEVAPLIKTRELEKITQEVNIISKDS